MSLLESGKKSDDLTSGGRMMWKKNRGAEGAGKVSAKGQSVKGRGL